MNKMQTVTAEEAPATPKKKRLPKKKRWGIMLAIPLLLLAVGIYWWIASASVVETDNAAVKQDIVAVSAQVNGPIIEVAVKNGDRVRAGQLLYRIDPAPFEVAAADDAVADAGFGHRCGHRRRAGRPGNPATRIVAPAGAAEARLHHARCL
jgi:membrane fusion protein (multidrug efflux system)